MGLKKPCLQSRTQWQLQMGPRRPAGHRQADPHRPGHQPFVFPCCEISTSHSSLLLCMAASSQTLSLRQMQCTCTHAWAEGSARRQPQSVDCLVHLSDANREIWMRFSTSFFNFLQPSSCSELRAYSSEQLGIVALPAPMLYQCCLGPLHWKGCGS